MASSRKKQDENNLKTLRELGALPQNKFCFDCGQRGPTYVNVTIGSFVCTKCSGMLRGLTPPHRVKSISMATFTPEEIDTIRGKGNDYCRKVWLGLYEGTPRTSSDEQHVRDFMVEKYERERYYLKKGMTKTEVPNTRPSSNTSNTSTGSSTKSTANGFTRTSTSTTQNNIQNVFITNGSSRSRPEVKSINNNINGALGGAFPVDFDKADIFSNTSTSSNSSQSSQQNGFANFDDNPVFNNNPASGASKGFPTPSALNIWTAQQSQHPPAVLNGGLNNSMAAPLIGSAPTTAPIEDKYAALKDLDNEMKSAAQQQHMQNQQQQHQQQQQQQDVWSTPSGSTGSLYSSPTPTTGSLYGSPSSQGSLFGSPSQGHFMSAFPPTQDAMGTISNPFSNGSTAVNWGATNGTNGFNGACPQPTQQFVNPFRNQSKTNGFQPTFPVNGMSNGWTANPFKVSTAPSMNPNNPFL